MGPISRDILAPTARDILRASSVPFDADNAMQSLSEAVGGDDLDLVILFVSPKTDIDGLIARRHGAFGDSTIIGCSTAGEISGSGYSENEIVAVGLPKSHFRTRTTLVSDLDVYDPQAVIEQMVQARGELSRDVPDWTHEFNFLLIDGMSGKEDGFAVALSPGWGPAPLFGGSAGDGTRFEKTTIIHDGNVFAKDTATITQIRTCCPIKVFKTDHVDPTGQRMVVTKADPARRLVQEINAEPAAQEYARMAGIAPENLSPAVLGTNPVVVRIAGQHFVRGIRNVTEDGSLHFTAAIDEGLVLTLARTTDMVAHLDEQMRALSAGGALAGIVACDCLYRRTDAQENDVTADVSQIMSRHRVFGFSSYGELFNSMHVNQTMTGVAIYAPPSEA